MNLKVMIVEDDRNYRYAIKNIIDWLSSGFEIAAEAVNGKQALLMLETKKIDVIITDISMPQMNGVELIKQVRIQYPSIKLIALSAYDEFDFVKEALKCGAEDYVLKYQLDALVVEKVLFEVKQKIVADNSTDKFTSFIRQNNKQLVEDLIKEILTDKSEDINKMNNYLELMSIDGEKARIIIIVLQTRFIHKEEEINNLKRLISKKAFLCRMESKRFVIMLDFTEYKSTFKIHEELMVAATSIRTILSKDKDENVTMGVSEICNGIDGIRKAYEQACAALGNMLYQGTGKTFFYQKKDNLTLYLGDEFEAEFRQLKNIIIEKKADEVLKIINNILSSFLNEMPEISKLEQLILDIFLIVHMTAFKIEAAVELSLRFIEEFRKSVQAEETAAKKTEVLLKEVKKICLNLNKQSIHVSKEIQKSIDYIYDNYKKDFSLTDIAEYVGLSANYLCNLFKQETGKRLMKFVNIVRIEKAKRLLNETNLKVYEIAESVGFQNTTYFSSTFRKITNMTVMEYKKSMKIQF